MSDGQGRSTYAGKSCVGTALRGASLTGAAHRADARQRRYRPRCRAPPRGARPPRDQKAGKHCMPFFQFERRQPCGADAVSFF